MRGETTKHLLGAYICEQLRQETTRATGCTEVAAASLVIAKAVEILGETPDKVELVVSPNVYKNGAFAGVPGMAAPGFLSAVALGAVVANTSLGLNLLANVDRDTIVEAEAFRATAQIAVKFKRTPSPLYFHTIVSVGDNVATATISDKHDHFIEGTKNGEVIYSDAVCDSDETERPHICTIPVRSLLMAIETIPTSDLEFLLDGAEMNATVYKNHINKSACSLASILHQKAQLSQAPAHLAQAWAGGASEARMSGSTDPVTAITGSGNQGITNFSGTYGVAHAMGASREQTIRALAVSSLVTVVIKAYTGKLTSFCGCSIAPATGIAAATVYLKGGSVEAMEHAMQSVIGTYAGMLCDGAKISCAYKVSAVVGGAVDLAHMALQGAYIPDGDGVLGQTVDESFTNLATLNNPGMQETETTVLGML